MPAPDERRLDIPHALSLIQPGGKLANVIQTFESRSQQQEMMRGIIEAYHDRAIALIEAGTGTGKSVAYLIPAILRAVQFGERTVISTNTIPLQEQLIEKDIPMILKALGVEIKAVLVKGMGNYLCVRKFDEALGEMELLPSSEAAELQQVEAWRARTKDGSLSELPFGASHATIERVGAEHDTCTGRSCPAYKNCFYWRSRHDAEDAQILVVNHHLLFTDLKQRAAEDDYKETMVLPAYDHVIIDEAHNIEDIATAYFASRVSHWEVIRLMTRLSAEKTGRLTALRMRFIELLLKQKDTRLPIWQEISSRLEIDLPGQRRDLIQRLSDLFLHLDSFIQRFKRRVEDDESSQPGEIKVRLLPQITKHPEWLGIIQPTVQEVVGLVRGYCLSLDGLQNQLLKLPHGQFEEQTAGLRQEIRGLTNRLTEMVAILENIVLKPAGVDRVRWMESYPLRGVANVNLIDADLDVSKLLVEYLFEPFQTVTLCSATLTTKRDFRFFRQRLGLGVEQFTKKKVNEQVYDSPFNYLEQALLVVPTDLPPPSDPHFLELASEAIWKMTRASRGNALVLFTSYQMLRQCHGLLKERFATQGYPLLRQGDESRKRLLAKFRQEDRSVLFATYSFWEGVDIAGDTLRCVIIVKLPFKVPTEPILEARAEALAAAGRNAFLELAVPLAAVKFKQGCGRLIRNRYDRGCIVCLDSRILTKAYGTSFLHSLPESSRVFDTLPLVCQAMGAFYRKTQYLVRKARGL